MSYVPCVTATFVEPGKAEIIVNGRLGWVFYNFDAKVWYGEDDTETVTKKRNYKSSVWAIRAVAKMLGQKGKFDVYNDVEHMNTRPFGG